MASPSAPPATRQGDSGRGRLCNHLAVAALALMLAAQVRAPSLCATRGARAAQTRFGVCEDPPPARCSPIRAEPEARFGSGYAPCFIPAPCPGVRCSVTPRRLRAVFAFVCVSWAAVRRVLERRPGGEWMARAHLPSTRAIRLSLPAVASARGTARGAQRLGPAWAC